MSHQILTSFILINLLTLNLSSGILLPRRLAPEDADASILSPVFSSLQLDDTFHLAKDIVVQRRKLEANLERDGLVTDMSKETAVTRHQAVTTTLERGNDLEKRQEVFEEMSKLLARNMSHDPILPSATGIALARIELVAPETRQAVANCKEDQHYHCDPYKPYRNSDGSCNNLHNPGWGTSFSCFTRLLPPAYADGLSAPRISVTGSSLPNPRVLSAVLHRDLNYPATYTHMTMQYGQFFSHDVAFTPSSRTKDGKMIQCCPPSPNNHPQCYPILVPKEDPFYSGYNEYCLNFVRTAMCPQCKLGPREQMNQITSYIDGSMVYGSMENETRSLWTRTGPAGRMHISMAANGGELLPHSPEPDSDQCSKPSENMYCFKAGDKRVNQHPALTALHVVFLRQHNKIVNELKAINPHWDGERLYQEARRINVAQIQMVTYGEWLPIIIGPDAMKFLKLYVLPYGYTDYDPYTNPNVINEFAGAAFRFGHSLVNSVFAEILDDGKPSGYRLRENFFTPFGFYHGQLDAVIRGLVSQASQNRDPFISQDMKNHLYRPKDSPYGLDLPAFNIQRGRDHGLSGYTDYLKFCFDEKIYDWAQLDQYMPTSQRTKFQNLYKSVHDVDLFSAGLAEYPLPGAAVGPTFTCIIGIQMYNLKFGDRFWFEHRDQAGTFSPDQLQEIRKTTFAQILCANSDKLSFIQKNVFRGESKRNPVVPCNTLTAPDLRAWRDSNYPGAEIPNNYHP
ncbi:peroxidase isoform X1 [Tetranychus urticae]|nr:peroxidase isoform X1 [Tetranychus urticae]